MDNVKPSDAERFFANMPTDLQIEAIRQLERQKKPPDSIELLYRSQQRGWEDFKAQRAERVGDSNRISPLLR